MNLLVEYRCKDEKLHTVQIESESSDPDVIKALLQKRYKGHRPISLHKITEV